ncbi:hypothetical protein M405DRAFT_521681 [Rhizopogon salebrosus TDB-379]|nr:hypothetical protein M405DRAFT_521681 [Rhizopogon salebrosus TDB-379]
MTRHPLVETRADILNEQHAQQTATDIQVRKYIIYKNTPMCTLTLPQSYPPPRAYHGRNMPLSIMCRQNTAFTCNMSHRTMSTVLPAWALRLHHERRAVRNPILYAQNDAAVHHVPTNIAFTCNMSHPTMTIVLPPRASRLPYERRTVRNSIPLRL